MWLWARAHSDWLTQHLPFHRNRIPALEMFWILLCRFDWSSLLGVGTGSPGGRARDVLEGRRGR